jgi:hypothetical protein
LVLRLRESEGRIPINDQEALAFWVTVLQRLAAECEFGTNSDPIEDAPALMALRDHERFAKIDLLKDDPQNIMNERWTVFELRADRELPVA